jgi:hypothetical protein
MTCKRSQGQNLPSSPVCTHHVWDSTGTVPACGGRSGILGCVANVGLQRAFNPSKRGFDSHRTHQLCGSVGERLKPLVLKTRAPNGAVGSNPTASAIKDGHCTLWYNVSVLEVGRVSGTVSHFLGKEAHRQRCAGSSPVPSASIGKWRFRLTARTQPFQG